MPRNPLTSSKRRLFPKDSARNSLAHLSHSMLEPLHFPSLIQDEKAESSQLAESAISRPLLEEMSKTELASKESVNNLRSAESCNDQQIASLKTNQNLL